MIVRCFVLALFLLTVVRDAHADQRVIVRVAGGSAVVDTACRLLRCSLLRSLGDPLSQVFVIAIGDGQLTLDLLTRLLGPSRILSLEPDLRVGIVIPTTTSPQLPASFLDTRTDTLDGVSVWWSYAQQPAVRVIRSAEGRLGFGVRGSGPVAVIDTGVDPTHPVLRNVLLPGYDFTRNRQGASEVADLSHSTTAGVDGGPTALANGMIVDDSDQSTTAVVDDPRHRGFGHGTMVAGIVHLVAPRAQILPLKAFGSDGVGYTSDIIRAVYSAVSSSARVINMSFSMTSTSSEFNSAIAHAVSRQVICVSSAGNEGKRTSVYPAALDTVIGVASTNLMDQRSSFSNYGDSLVWIAAPGEQIISTYPFGKYAAAYGTSFSTPFVSGTGALLVDARPSIDHGSAARAIANGKQTGGELGHGRLDVFNAIAAVHLLR